MTVRIAKQPVNIREKLSELERPIGVKGNELMRAETAQDARDLVSAGRKNLIINGDMRIAQRSIGPVQCANAYNLLDRWMTTSGFSVTMVSRSTDAPEGFTYSFRHNRTSGSAVTTIGSANWSTFLQQIEGHNTAFLNWGTPSAKAVTLSFWVKCNYPGKYSVSLNNAASFDTNSYSSTHCYVAEYYINFANVWEYKTITVPGAPNGTWAKDNSSGMQIWFELGSGSAVKTSSSNANKWISGDFKGLDDQMNLYTVADHDWKITGVQLEVGKNATEFEHRSYGEELALCQRYYQIATKIGDYVGAFAGRSTGTTSIAFSVPLTVPMRSAPSLTESVVNPFYAYSGGARAETSSGTIALNSSNGWAYYGTSVFLAVGGFSGLTDDRIYNIGGFGSGSKIVLDSEL